MDLPKGVGCLMFFMKGWLIIGQTLEPLIILGQAATKGKKYIKQQMQIRDNRSQDSENNKEKQHAEKEENKNIGK